MSTYYVFNNKSSQVQNWEFIEKAPYKPKYAKSGSALGTLQDIEAYIWQFREEGETGKLETFKGRAKEITDRYQSRIGFFAKICHLFRRLLGLKVEWNEIKEINQRIQSTQILAQTYPQALITDINGYVASFLNIEDLGRLAQVSKNCQKIAKQAFVHRAKTLIGYQGEEASTYLADLKALTLDVIKTGKLSRCKNIEEAWSQVKKQAQPFDWNHEFYLLHYILSSATVKKVGQYALLHGLKTAVEQENASYQRLFLYSFMNTQDVSGLTFLDTVCALSDLKMVEYLLDRGADPMIGAPLHFAIINNQLNIIECLLSHQPALLNMPMKNTFPLDTACMESKLETVKYLLDCGADPMMADCLLLAISRNRVDIAACLLSYKPDLINKSYALPYLHWAIEKGHINSVKYLLSYKPDLINVLDANGRTPLSLAQEHSKEEIAKCLLEHGALS